MYITSQELLPDFIDVSVSKESKELRAVSVGFAS